MDRRKAIKQTSVLLGIAVSTPLHILQSCTVKKEIGWIPEFLTQEQAVTVGEVSQRILPVTNSPGALEVGVDAFIDKMLKDNYKQPDQKRFLEGLSQLEDLSQEQLSKTFVECDPLEKDELLMKLETDVEAWKKDGNYDEKPFFLMVKELTLLGYFTSEDVMVNHLEYVPVPGRFVGCVPETENQKIRVGNHV